MKQAKYFNLQWNRKMNLQNTSSEFFRHKKPKYCWNCISTAVTIPPTQTPITKILNLPPSYFTSFVFSLTKWIENYCDLFLPYL